ncbi:unnamed protein product [Staurois parvus]|uniref:Uncharacterized protein n=1 Tax=Staurois parvus TaxID=386267 RepID=A0ABN9FAR1_9NEOB|nr:unnamed protein product [Staurois parvus]
MVTLYYDKSIYKKKLRSQLFTSPLVTNVNSKHQGRTDRLSTRALPEGPGSVGGPMRCPWYLS